MLKSYRNLCFVVLAGALSLYGQGGILARGKYLVEEVAKCQDCDTPRLATGDLDASRWLKGVNPGKSAAVWEIKAPNVTSGGELWKRWGVRAMREFLETGRNPDGHLAKAPMPTYKLRQDDAQAIVEYIQSLH